MYEHLSPIQRQRIQVLERKTTYTMTPEERAEYMELIKPPNIVPIVPPGQKVEEVFDTAELGLQRNPYIGLWVTYYSRPGEGRDAKTRFPAMVMETHGIDSRTGRWLVRIAVQYTPTESGDVRCLQRTEADRFGTWDYAEDPYWSIIKILNSRLETTEKFITDLMTRMAALEAKLQGNGRGVPPAPPKR